MLPWLLLAWLSALRWCRDRARACPSNTCLGALSDVLERERIRPRQDSTTMTRWSTLTTTRVWCITMTCTIPQLPRHKVDKGNMSMVTSSIMRVLHPATPLMIPSSTIFWKVSINCMLTNEGVHHGNLIQANSKKCQNPNSNNNSRSRSLNSKPLPQGLSRVPPQFIRLRHHNSNNHSDNLLGSNNHNNNRGLSRKRSRLHNNRQIAHSSQVLGNPSPQDRDKPHGSESLP